MKIKKGDEVVVISGKYKGVKGKVLEARPSESRVVLTFAIFWDITSSLVLCAVIPVALIFIAEKTLILFS